MIDLGWERRDEESGEPGHQQLVAGSGTFSVVRQAYAALLEHGAGCETCRKGDCDTADALYGAWRDLGGPWKK